MKTYQFISILLSGFILISSCSGKTSSTQTSTGAESSPAISNNSSGDCILSYQSKYDKLLPLNVIQKHFKGDMSKAEKEYQKSEKPSGMKTDKYIYKWKSNRTETREIMGQKITIPIQNEIGLKWIGSDLFMIKGLPTPLENFKQFYRNASKEEKEAAFKKAEEVMKEKGYDEKTTKTAIEMGKGLGNDKIIFKDIADVGDAALWRIQDKYLTVLVGKTTFQVVANVSTNDDENIELAKKLAIEVLNKCK